MDTRTGILNVMSTLGIDTTNITDETRLKEDLEMDSTEYIELAVAIERQLSVPVEDKPFMALKTFGAVVNYIDECKLAVSA